MRNPCASRQGFGFRSAVDLSVWFASGLVQLAKLPLRVEHLVSQLERALQSQDTRLKAAVTWSRGSIRRRRRRTGQLRNSTLQITDLQIGKLQFLVAVSQVLLQLRYARCQIPDLLFSLVQVCHVAGHDRSAGRAAGYVRCESFEGLKAHLS